MMQNRIPFWKKIFYTTQVKTDDTSNIRAVLNNAILLKFRDAGIEIAYPQRDLHVRSVSADLGPLSGSAGTTAPTS